MNLLIQVNRKIGRYIDACYSIFVSDALTPTEPLSWHLGGERRGVGEQSGVGLQTHGGEAVSWGCYIGA